MTIPKYRWGNRLICGSTRCGKSTAEIIEIIAAAMTPATAVVVVDPHAMSLAWNALVQLVSRGMRKRVLFDQLGNLDRVLGYRFLRPSRAKDSNRREAENEQTIREFMDVLIRRRDVQSLASHPLTEEYIFDAISLVIYQTVESLASDIQFAFEIHENRFRELVAGCTKTSVKQKFQAIKSGEIKPGQYASARRLIRSVCSSPAFTLRCHRSFDLTRFLNSRGVLLVEGAPSGISPDTANTIMGAIVLQVIHYVRSREKAFPRVLLVLDEATNAALLGSAGHEVRALAELQKKGLDVHILVQSPTFASSFVEDGVMTNCIEHHWFFSANDAVAQKAARDLGDPEYRARIRDLRQGQRFIKRLNRVSFDQVTPLDDLWSWPGLGEKKAKQALTEILKRNEYWSPSTCQVNNPPKQPNEPSQLPNLLQGEPTQSNESLPLQTDTSASPDTSIPSSPADRLRIARQQRCERPEGFKLSDT